MLFSIENRNMNCNVQNMNYEDDKGGTENGIISGYFHKQETYSTI